MHWDAAGALYPLNEIRNVPHWAPLLLDRSVPNAGRCVALNPTVVRGGYCFSLVLEDSHGVS